MAVADLVVSKPAKLTTSETLARGAVMYRHPIPGQRPQQRLPSGEWRSHQGNTLALPYKMATLLAVPVRLLQLKANVVRA